MAGEYVLFGVLVVGAIYGFYKYSLAESNDYKKLLDVVQSLKADVKEIKSSVSRIDRLESSIANYQEVVEEVQREIDSAQDHMAKIRDSQVELRDRSYPRTIEFKVQAPSGPIPIEIYTPSIPTKEVTRKAFTRTKNGYSLREEKRKSKIEGDPNKYDWPTSRQKQFKKITKQINKLSQ